LEVAQEVNTIHITEDNIPDDFVYTVPCIVTLYQ